METPVTENATTLKAASQFSLRSLLVSTFTAAMVLGYVRLFGEWATSMALIGFGLALSMGVVVGWLSGRFAQTLIWALVCYVLILCSMLSSYRLDQIQVVHWLAVGSLIGTLAGVNRVGQVGFRFLLGVGFWLLVGLAQWLHGDLAELWIDWLLTLLVAVALLELVEVVDWLQKKYRTPLDMWAAGLVFAVIAGNFGAIVVWNLWYA